MSRAAADLEARRRLLVARSALERLELASGVQALREGLVRPRSVLSLIASPPVVAMVLGLAGRGRALRLARLAAAAFALARVARSFWKRG